MQPSSPFAPRSEVPPQAFTPDGGRPPEAPAFTTLPLQPGDTVPPATPTPEQRVRAQLYQDLDVLLWTFTYAWCTVARRQSAAQACLEATHAVTARRTAFTVAQLAEATEGVGST